jgi:hypothetical protein
MTSNVNVDPSEGRAARNEIHEPTRVTIEAGINAKRWSSLQNR